MSETDLPRNTVPVMQRALELAARAHGQTRPNPLVGCVILGSDGATVLGEGWHERAGEPHAERNALAACTASPRGGTAVVTLEPCAHHGRTPPCTQALIEAGIARVIVAQRDPNAQARGGIEALRAAGVDVHTGVCAHEAVMLNAAFNTYHRLGRPLVTLKWAISADGATAAASGHSQWITGDAARGEVQTLRAGHDAVLAGIETVLRDNARLSLRDFPAPAGPPLRRVVLDSRLRLPVDHPFVKESRGLATVLTAPDAPEDRERALRDAGAEVWRLERGEGGLSIPVVLEALRGAGVQSVLVEGGRRVAGAFVGAGCVDRVMAFVAPVLVGSGEHNQSALAMAVPAMCMDSTIRLHHAEWGTIGADAVMRGWISHHLFEVSGWI